MTERLWAPWRLEYVTQGAKKPGCIFCDALDMGDDRPAHILLRASWNFVIVNIYPYNNGHLMIVPYEHLTTPTDATHEQTAEMMDLLKVCQRVLTDAYHPEGFNIGMNLGKCAGAGVLEHYHLHIVPRWGGDTNYMTVTGETRVLIEDLAVTDARLRPLFVKYAQK
ncbi:MAG: HIT domain-containing protein [Acidobacteriota bacterium]